MGTHLPFSCVANNTIVGAGFSALSALGERPKQSIGNLVKEGIRKLLPPKDKDQ